MKALFLVLAFCFAAGATPLGDVADTLKPGQWGVLNTDSFPSWSATDEDIFAYANTGCWFEDSGFALFVGSKHAGHYHHLLTYVDSSNTWRCGPKLDGNIFPYTFGTHAYDNDALDPTRAAFWYNPKGNDLSVACGADYACASDQFRRRFLRYDIRTGVWDNGIVMPDTFPQPSNTTALKYFPEMDGLVFVNAVGYAQAARVFFYSFQTATWRILGEGMPMGGESMFCQYGSRRKIILFGGGYLYPSTPLRYMYAIDSTGAIDTLASIPDAITKGIACEGGGLNTKFLEDPATGDFLAIGDDSTLWCYNPPHDYWQKLPKAPVLKSHSGGAFSISRYGVVMFVQTDVDRPGIARVLIYKHGHPHQDTVLATALHVTSPVTTTERYLAIPLTVTIDFSDARTDTVTQTALYQSLDTAIAKMEPGGVVRGVRSGQVEIEVMFINRMGSIKDTITLEFTPTTATIDSVRFCTDTGSIFMTPRHFVLARDLTYAMTGTVYGHAGAESFTHPLDSGLTWTSSDTAVATAVYGTIMGKTPGGPVAVVASQGGQSDTAWFTVFSPLSFIKRINFQNGTRSAPFGWEWQDYYTQYSTQRGYGWLGSPDDANNVTAGSNYLLKTRVRSYSGDNFRIDLPDGEYIVKAAMGDIAPYMGADNWLVSGTDTLLKWTDRTGEAGVQVCTLSVTGGSLNLKFMGYFCYCVVISNEGADINAVADDGGLIDNIPGSGSAAGENGAFCEATDFSVSPNPFNPAVRFAIPGPLKNASLRIFSCSGALAADLTGRTEWNASGRPSGLYFAVLENNDKRLVRKLVLAK